MLILLLNTIFILAQTNTVSGVLTEKDATTPIPGVNIFLRLASDTTQLLVETTDAKGVFLFKNLSGRAYRLRTQMLGYKEYAKFVRLKNGSVNLGVVSLTPNVTEIGEVTVKGYVPPAVQKGDSVEMRADAVKVNKDASAEDLVKKMPGITNENGTLKSQGEEIKKVLVDGKVFFGDDASLALKNLPAEVIDKVQVFNKMSDQAQFTGFDDGNSVRTMNIVTKESKRHGWFGKIYGGSDFYSKYLAGTNLNYFNGNQKLSIVGLTNNVNQQNFGAQDMFGGGRGGSNFFGGQNGITTTNSIGLNYSGTLGSKIVLSGSYFFNNSSNNSITDTYREYFLLADKTNQSTKEHSESITKNYNHRVNLRVEYNIDSVNAIIFTPRVSFQTNDANTDLFKNKLLRSGKSSVLKQISSSNNNGYSASTDLLFRHKFALAGRSVSLSVTPSISNKDSEKQNLNNENSVANNQLIKDLTDGWGISSRFTYTEPLNKKSNIQVNYGYSLSNSKLDKETDSLGIDLLPKKRIVAQSNNYESTYTTHRPGVSYRYRTEKLNASVGVDYQIALLDGMNNDSKVSVNKSFTNTLPNLMVMYKISKQTNLRLNYRSNTNAPSVSQLQDITDYSDPFLITKGNPNLKQEYSHNMFMRFSTSNAEKATNMFMMLGGSYTLDPIGTKIITKSEGVLNDKEFEAILKNIGDQLSYPVNLDYSWNVRGMISYGFPVPFIKSNLNLFTGYNFSQTPAYTGDVLNRASTHGINNGVTLSSNVSEDVDFTVSYNSNVSITKNTAQMPQQSDNRYWNQSAGISFNWVIWKGIVLRNDVSGQFNKGLSSSEYNQNYTLWNASLGKKLFKDESGEIKLSVYDILNQNKSLSHTVNVQYIEDTRTNIMKQYVMLTFTYNIRSFGQKGNDDVPRDMDGRPGPPPGSRPFGPPPGGHDGRPGGPM